MTKKGFNFKEGLFFQVTTNTKLCLKLFKTMIDNGALTLEIIEDYMNKVLDNKCSYKNEYLLDYRSIPDTFDIANNLLEGFILHQMIKFKMVYCNGHENWDRYDTIESYMLSKLKYSKNKLNYAGEGSLIGERNTIRTTDNDAHLDTIRTNLEFDGYSYNTSGNIMFSSRSLLDYGIRNARVYPRYMFDTFDTRSYITNWNSSNTAFMIMSTHNIAKIFFRCIKEGINPYDKYKYTINSNRLLIDIDINFSFIGMMIKPSSDKKNEDTIINRIFQATKSATHISIFVDACRYTNYEVLDESPIYISPCADVIKTNVEDKDLYFNYKSAKSILTNLVDPNTNKNTDTKGYDLIGNGSGFCVKLFEKPHEYIDDISEKDKFIFKVFEIIYSYKFQAPLSGGYNNKLIEMILFSFLYNGFYDAYKEDKSVINYIEDNYCNITCLFGKSISSIGLNIQDYKYIRNLIERMKDETRLDDYYSEYKDFYVNYTTASAIMPYDEDSDCFSTVSIDANLHIPKYYRKIRELKIMAEDGSNDLIRNTYPKYSIEYNKVVDRVQSLFERLFLDKFGRYPRKVYKLARAIVGVVCHIDFYSRDEICDEEFDESKLPANRIQREINRFDDENEISFLRQLTNGLFEKFNRDSIRSMRSVMFANEYLVSLAVQYDFSRIDFRKRLMLNYYIDTASKYCAAYSNNHGIFPYVVKNANKLSESNMKLILENFDLVKDCKNIKEAKRKISECRAIEEKEKYENEYNISFPECNSISLKDAPVHLNGLTMRMLDADDNKNFVVGLETNCCYHYSGAAQDSLLYSITMPNSANVVIENASKDILATAWVWATEVLLIEPYSEDEGEAPEPRTRDMLVFDNIEFANDADISLYIDIIKEYVEALPYDFINMGLGYNNIDDRYFEDMDVISKETGIKFMRLGEIPSEYDGASYMDDIDDIYTDYESGFKDGYVVLKRCGKCFINLDVDLNDQTENDDYDRNIQERFLKI